MTHYRIIEEIRDRIKWLDKSIEDYNGRITKARVEKKFDLCDSLSNYRNENMVERDILIDMLRSAGLKPYLDL